VLLLLLLFLPLLQHLCFLLAFQDFHGFPELLLVGIWLLISLTVLLLQRLDLLLMLLLLV